MRAAPCLTSPPLCLRRELASLDTLIDPGGRCPVPIHPSEDPANVASASLFGLVTLTAPDGVSAMQQTLWPRHCVQGSWGSQLHADLPVPPGAIAVYKGTAPVTPPPAGFEPVRPQPRSHARVAVPTQP